MPSPMVPPMNVLEYMFYALDYNLAVKQIKTSLDEKDSEIRNPSGHMLVYPQMDDPSLYFYSEYIFIKNTGDYLLGKGLPAELFGGEGARFETTYEGVMEEYSSWMYDKGYLK